jgi:aminoglycoside 3-N-acetyltransferase
MSHVDHRLPDPRQDIDEAVPIGVITRQEIVAGLRRMGLKENQKVFVHSGTSVFGHVCGGPATIMEAILEVIGPGGTVMTIPNYGLAYRGDVDLRKPPPTLTGAIPRIHRSLPGAKLSLHPSHPVAVSGPHTKELIKNHHLGSTFGIGSPPDRLAKMGGHVLLLGVNQRVNTTIHTGEHYAGVPYWGHVPYAPPGRWVTTLDGTRFWAPIIDPPGCSEGFRQVESFLDERGVVGHDLIGRARCHMMRGQELIEAVAEFLRSDPGRLLCRRSFCRFCPSARELVA